MDYELLSLLIIGCRCFHLNCIVSIAQLGEAEATHVLEAIDFFVHELLMPICVKSYQSATE